MGGGQCHRPIPKSARQPRKMKMPHVSARSSFSRSPLYYVSTRSACAVRVRLFWGLATNVDSGCIPYVISLAINLGVYPAPVLVRTYLPHRVCGPVHACFRMPGTPRNPDAGIVQFPNGPIRECGQELHGALHLLQTRMRVDLFLASRPHHFASSKCLGGLREQRPTEHYGNKTEIIRNCATSQSAPVCRCRSTRQTPALWSRVL